MNGISIIIPIFNEASNLPGLLEAIMAQTLKPDEVIFVDSGSTDKTDQIIARYSDGSIQIRHIKNLGGMPGGNRNKGILESKYDWIAFIDAGIIPRNNWLEELMKCAKQNNTKSIFGKCQFMGTTAFSHAVCAVSYGCTSHPVIPASMFHKDIFNEVGLFPENLRAGEDTIWLDSFDQIYGSRISPNHIVASYNSFPKNIGALIQKYHIYELSLITARLGNVRAMLLTFYFLILTFAIILDISIGLIFFMAYLVLRGVLDPIRRSRSINWWQKFPASLFLVLVCALAMDITVIYTRTIKNFSPPVNT